MSDEPPRMTRAYVGLGSNLGDRRMLLEQAIQALAAESGVALVARSRLYESEPVGVTNQPWFLNCAVAVDTGLSPRDLLTTLKRIERRLGRQPGRRWGPRLIDLDLLVYGAVTVSEPDLTVPHPELWRRLFVLLPLADLAPKLRAPDERSIDEVIADLEGSALARPLADERWAAGAA